MCVLGIYVIQRSLVNGALCISAVCFLSYGWLRWHYIAVFSGCCDRQHNLIF